jgi:thiol-disulfide isomerase/thioredoxin
MNKLKPFFKKNWNNILFALVIVVLLFPQTRMPFQVFIQRLVAFSPSELDAEEQVDIANYSWELIKLEGGTDSLKASEGKVVIVNLWATWCPPCVAEMPSMQALYDAYGDQVDFYFVSAEEKSRLTKFLQKNEYNLPVYKEASKAPEIFRVTTIPTTFVISKKGKLIMKTTGAADWNSDEVHAVLDKLLAE